MEQGKRYLYSLNNQLEKLCGGKFLFLSFDRFIFNSLFCALNFFSRCERMNPSIILEDCLVKDTNHKLLTMDTLIGDIDARFLLVEKKKM